MQMILLGYKHLDFTNDKGESIRGIQASVSYAEDGVEGQRADRLFFKEGFLLPDLTPGMTLDVVFNRKGKAEQVVAVPTSQKLNLGKQ